MDKERVPNPAGHRPRGQLQGEIAARPEGSHATFAKGRLTRLGGVDGDAGGVEDLMVTKESYNTPARRTGLTLERSQQLKALELLRAAVKNVANLHERSVAARPRLALVDETCNMQRVDECICISMNVTNGHSARGGVKARGAEQRC